MLDLILAGGGLANGLLAYRLRTQRPELRLLVIDQAPQLGNATWSFHAADLTPAQNAWMEPFVGHRWECYDVAFPAFNRRIELGYRSVPAARFRAVLSEALGSDLRLNTAIEAIRPDGVTLRTGERLDARAVIDGSGFRPSQRMIQRYQKFLGLEIRLVAPHGLDAPIMMDATVEQEDGFRFIYILPFASDRLLIEDTYYADTNDLPRETLRARILSYAALRGWTPAEIMREESGVLPVTLSGNITGFWNDIEAGLPRSGMRAGLFHPTTGFSLPDAVRLADNLVKLPALSSAGMDSVVRHVATERWRRHAFFRLLNRMLFLAGPPRERFIIMRRFYTLSEALIARFYAGNLTLVDQARLLIGRPPVQIRGALRAIVASGR